MKKNKMLALAIAAVMALSVFALSACSGGGGSQTLEDYCKNHKDLMDQITSAAESDDHMSAEVSGNTINWTYAYTDEYDEATRNNMAIDIKSAIGSYEKTFTALISSVESQSGIKDVKMHVLYKDKAGNEIYYCDYDKDGMTGESEVVQDESGSASLEEYNAKTGYVDSSMKAAVAADAEHMSYSLSGNTVTMVYKFDDVYTEEQIASAKSSIESAISGQESNFTRLVDVFENASGIDEVLLRVRYVDAADTEIYSKDFSN